METQDKESLQKELQELEAKLDEAAMQYRGLGPMRVQPLQLYDFA